MVLFTDQMFSRTGYHEKDCNRSPNKKYKTYPAHFTIQITDKIEALLDGIYWATGKIPIYTDDNPVYALKGIYNRTIHI